MRGSEGPLGILWFDCQNFGRGRFPALTIRINLQHFSDLFLAGLGAPAEEVRSARDFPKGDRIVAPLWFDGPEYSEVDAE